MWISSGYDVRLEAPPMMNPHKFSLWKGLSITSSYLKKNQQGCWEVPPQLGEKPAQYVCVCVFVLVYMVIGSRWLKCRLWRQPFGHFGEHTSPCGPVSGHSPSLPHAIRKTAVELWQAGFRGSLMARWVGMLKLNFLGL